MRLEPVLRSKRSHRNEKPAHHDEEYPLLAATRESPRVATKTQRSQKIKIIKKNSVESSSVSYHHTVLALSSYSISFIIIQY